DAGAWWQYLFPFGFLAVLATLWAFRKKIGSGPLVAVLFFGGTLFPALGFINVYPMRYSFVADHFQYLASIGLIALAVGAIALQTPKPARAKEPDEVPVLFPWRPVVGCAVLLVFGFLTWQQGYAYAGAEALWTDTLRKNPQSRMAHNNLGTHLARRAMEAP